MGDETKVLYNATCPLCAREVGHYARLSEEAALPIRYDDCTDPVALQAWGITADAAARRFHVRKDGVTHSGIPAFLVLWQEIPRTRWLARLVALPGIRWLATRGYDHLLAPVIYRLHLRRLRKSTS